ncbi:MAG TPA: radical SAM protein [Candidatus Deferrimicrobium sp.]|nr:radical SAM protein [Candidatus Deferrimicrobium sp.]
MIKYVFGPIPSRRLGISLGVDIIPYKTCSLDCLYCECGKTTELTLERKHFVDPGIVLAQIKEAIAGEKYIDYITFSGAGEPTLNIDIGTIISGLKEITHIPVAVLTNGTLLYLEEVRRDLARADLVLPSLDAVSPDVFSKINRPHKDLDINRIIQGIIDFRKAYHGKIWLEVFIAKGINDSPDELAKIYQAAKKINPDKVQLNSLDRPPAYDDVEAVAIEMLERVVEEWKDLRVEITTRTKKREEIVSFSRNMENSILNTIKRRPLTVEDLETLTGKKRAELFKYIDILEKEKKVKAQVIGNKIFYVSFSK